MKSNSDWDKPFGERYLECAQAMEKLEHWLMVVGLSGNSHFKSLQSDFIRHGGETFRDINRTALANTPAVGKSET